MGGAERKCGREEEGKWRVKDKEREGKERKGTNGRKTRRKFFLSHNISL